MCPFCGGDTRVLASRTVERPGKGAEVSRVSKVVGWYTADFVARRRRCKRCNATFMTAEITLEDCTQMMKEFESMATQKGRTIPKEVQ